MRPLIAGVLMALAGCERTVGPDADLSAARRRWNLQGIVDYTFEWRASCFCDHTVTRWHRIEVRGGRVVAATPLEPTGYPPVSAERLDDVYPTVERLFERAEWSAMPGHPMYGGYAHFDPGLGYPVEVMYGEPARDAGGWEYARALAPLRR